MLKTACSICACFFWFLAQAPALSQSRQPETLYLSLEDCIGRIVQVSPRLLADRDILDSDALKMRQKKKERWPQIQLSASDARIIDRREFSYFDPQSGQRYVPGEGYGLSVSASAPIYTGSRISRSIESQKHQSRIDAIQLADSERDLRIEVTGYYLDALQKLGQKQIRDHQLDQSRESLTQAKARLTAGRGIRYEVSLEESSVAQAEWTAMTALHDWNQSIRLLLHTLDYPIDLDVVLDPVDMPSPIDELLENLIQTGLNARLDFERLEHRMALNRAQLKVLEANRKPSIDLYATYEKQGTAWSDFSSDDNRYSMGIRLALSPFQDSGITMNSTRERIESNDYMQRSYILFDIFNGTSTAVSEFDLEMDFRQLEVQHRKIHDQVRMEILSAFDGQQEALKALEAARLEFRAATEHFEIQNKSYELGLIQLKDLVDARTEMNTAEIRQNNAEFNYIYSRAYLAYMLGVKDWSQQ